METVSYTHLDVYKRQVFSAKTSGSTDPCDYVAGLLSCASVSVIVLLEFSNFTQNYEVSQFCLTFPEQHFTSLKKSYGQYFELPQL